MEDTISNLLKAVEKHKEHKLGIAFSGGTDSMLLALACHKLNKHFTPYTVGLQDSEDIDRATKISIKMGWLLKVKLVSNSEIAETIVSVVNMLGTDDPAQVAEGCMAYAAIQFAKEDRAKILLFGTRKNAEICSKIAECMDMKIAFPLLDEGLESAKLDQKTALELGLPKELLQKKEGHHGSGFDKAIGMLAERNGHKTKKEYLASLLSDELEPIHPSAFD